MITLRYLTDNYCELATFDHLEDARRYFFRMLGTLYEVSCQGYALSHDGIGKLEILEGSSFKALLMPCTGCSGYPRLCSAC